MSAFFLWAPVGMAVGAVVVLVTVLVLSPVTPPPVDRGHDCEVNQWGCR